MKNLFILLKRAGLKKIISALFILILVFAPLHQAQAIFWFLPLVGSGAALTLFDYLTKGAVSGAFGGPTLAILSWIINFLKSIVSTVMTLAGTLFDYALQLSVSFNYGNIQAVEIAWAALRDICNILFIFLLLYIGIQTILGSASREMVQKLIYIVLVALVINFSLFATKVVVDTSNVVMLGIYNQVAQAAGDDKASLSFTFLHALKLTDDEARKNQNMQNLDKGNLIVVDIMSIALFAIVTWIFLQAAFLLIGRVVAFILLMIFSPLAFIGMVIPNSTFKKHTTDWWQELLYSQAIFGPVFLFLFLVTLKFATDPRFSLQLLSTDHGIDVSGLINFAIVIGLAYMSLKIAKQLSGGFGASVLSWGNSATGFLTGQAGRGLAGAVGGLGRVTFGKKAYEAINNDRFKNFATKNRFGQLLYTGTEKAAKGSWDVRNTSIAAGAGKLGIDLGKAGGEGGYKGRLEDQIKTREEFKKKMGSDKVYTNTEEGQKAEVDHKALIKREEGENNKLKQTEKDLAEIRVNGISKSGKNKAQVEKERFDTMLELEKINRDKTSIEKNPNLMKGLDQVYTEKLGERAKRPLGLVTQFLTRKANEKAAEKFSKEYTKKKGEDEQKWYKEEKKKKKIETERRIEKLKKIKGVRITEAEAMINKLIEEEEGKRGTATPAEITSIDQKIVDYKEEKRKIKNEEAPEDAEIIKLEKFKKDIGNTEDKLEDVIKKALGDKQEEEKS